MPRNWSNLADSTEGVHEVADFQRALAQLNAEQCLYARFQNQATSYRLISRFRSEFAEAALLAGNVLEFNDRHEYCYTTNRVARMAQMPLDETLFVLTLRYAYHTKASVGELDEDGVAMIELPELAEMHKAVTGRDLEMRIGKLRDLMSTAKKSGLAQEEKSDDGDEQPFIVAILPGISDVLGEHVINRFGAELKARLELVKADQIKAHQSSDDTTVIVDEDKPATAP